VGIAVSSLLMLQYAIPTTGLCGPGGGCETVLNLAPRQHRRRVVAGSVSVAFGGI